MESVEIYQFNGLFCFSGFGLQACQKLHTLPFIIVDAGL